MFWNHSIEGQNVTFNGVPFIVSATRKQHCQFGKLYMYFKERTASTGRTRLQGICKIGCPAHVHVHELTLFPSFAVSSESEACSLGSRKLKEVRHKNYRIKGVTHNWEENNNTNKILCPSTHQGSSWKLPSHLWSSWICSKSSSQNN